MFKHYIKNIIQWQIPTAMWGFVVLWLSLLPKVDVELPFQFKLIDKVVHFIFYAVMASSMLLGIHFSGYSIKSQTAKLLLLAVIAYGGIIELLQHYLVITRTGDWADFAANTAGALLAYFAFLKYLRVK